MEQTGFVTIVYTGPLSGVTVDALGGLTIWRGKPAKVPKWFADEKLALTAPRRDDKGVLDPDGTPDKNWKPEWELHTGKKAQPVTPAKGKGGERS